ncbi:MAG: FAD-binding oxidoreductase [candidate division WOR-3 bacterium]|nr:FAD-binding oxidoreductase [candidate division WOR-3 bacterium]
MYNRVSEKIIDNFISIIGKENVILEEESLENYAHDETPLYYSKPEVVLKPVNKSEISEIMKVASAHCIPVTPRGGGTSLSAGAVPLYHGIVLSLERMNKIREVDEENLMAIVEPGIITGLLEKELAKYNLFFPPDPVSLDSCTLGGNIAECAGGPRAMKYGVTKNYITGLEVVLPDGTVIKLGGKLLKNVTGYDLIDLFVGSEGTLGIVTEATIKTLVRPEIIIDLYIQFKTVAEASRFSIEVLKQGLNPTAIELMDGDVVRMVEKYLQRRVPHSEVDGHIIVEVDGNDKEHLKKIWERIGDIALKSGALDVLVAESVHDRERLWEIRKKIGDSLKAQTRIIAREDLVVPKNRIPDLIHQLKEYVKNLNCALYAFGHLGDGNIHTDVGCTDENLLLQTDWISQMRKKMYEITIGLGGTITAEHGIGLSKTPYLSLALDKKTIELMMKIKKEFDPKNILNPGKILSDITAKPCNHSNRL